MLSPLEESKQLIVRRWGEMGGYWGINRTMAEIYALMFVSTEPLCTDDVMEKLHISRGNASMNLRSLVDWGLISRVHKPGQRREYFEADTHVWHMFETIMRERRRREVEPILNAIDRCLEITSAPGATDAPEKRRIEEHRRRLADLRNFLRTMGSLFDLVLKFGGTGLEQLAEGLYRSITPAAAVAQSGAGRDPKPATNGKPRPSRATKAAGNRPRWTETN